MSSRKVNQLLKCEPYFREITTNENSDVLSKLKEHLDITTTNGME
jgi:hypothetical protein